MICIISNYIIIIIVEFLTQLLQRAVQRGEDDAMARAHLGAQAEEPREAQVGGEWQELWKWTERCSKLIKGQL